MRIKNSRPCQAKDPTTCLYHSAQVLENNEATHDASEIFEKLMAKNQKVQEIEAQVRWAKQMFKVLSDKRPVDIKTEMKGLSDYSEESVKILEHYNDSYSKLNRNLNEKQLTALRDYTGISFESVNLFLRDEKKFMLETKSKYLNSRLNHVKKTIETLDTIFTSASSENKTVYRYLTPDTTTTFTSSEIYAKNLGFVVDKEVTFSSYLSTTIDADLLSRYAEEGKEENTTVILVINTNKGIPVDYTATSTEGHTYTQSVEREILLPRNTRFKVKKITRDVGYPIGYSSNSRTVNPTTVYLEEIS
jgi:hypothetical protein